MNAGVRMNFLSRIFGSPKPPPAESALQSQSQSHSGSSQSSMSPAMSQDMRRELLRVTLRETLRRQGIPLAWIGADLLTATSRNGQTGIHWRLSIKHWDPRLLVHVVGLQNRLISRLQVVDPMAETWLMGVSWQVALEDESVCPPLPHPGSWTAPPAPLPAAWQPAAVAGGSGDVIAGPVRIEDSGDPVKADLDQLMAARDADFEANHDKSADTTQAMYMKTQPSQP